MNATEIIEALRNKLTVTSGRHLYGVLGSYSALEIFAKCLQEAKTLDGMKFPPPLSVNKGILEAIPEDEFRELAQNEAKKPEPTRAHVIKAFETFLRSTLQGRGLVVLNNLEMVFSYNMELSLLRSIAADDDQILLLLPGKRERGKIVLFPEFDNTKCTLPTNLITSDHLWELNSNN